MPSLKQHRPTTPENSSAQQAIYILFDGDCIVCQFSIGLLDTWAEAGHQLLFVPLQSPKGRSLLAHYQLPEAYSAEVVVIKYGKMQTGFLGLRQLRGTLKFPWWFNLLLSLPTPIGKLGYWVVARTRKWWGKPAACPLPHPSSVKG